MSWSSGTLCPSFYFRVPTFLLARLLLKVTPSKKMKLKKKISLPWILPNAGANKRCYIWKRSCRADITKPGIIPIQNKCCQDGSELANSRMSCVVLWTRNGAFCSDTKLIEMRVESFKLHKLLLPVYRVTIKIRLFPALTREIQLEEKQGYISKVVGFWRKTSSVIYSGNHCSTEVRLPSCWCAWRLH